MKVIKLKQPLSALYLLKKSGEIIYIGKSINVIRRLYSHKTKQVDEIEIIPTEVAKLSSEERRLLLLHRPVLNRSIAHPENIARYGVQKKKKRSNIIPKFLKKWIVRRNLSQSEAACILNVSTETFRNWIYGRNTPGPIVQQFIRNKCK
jgi:DNA-binding transcriptional regulator YiaG